MIKSKKNGVRKIYLIYFDRNVVLDFGYFRWFYIIITNC